MLGRVGVCPGGCGGCVFWFGEDDEQTLLGKLFEVDGVSDGSSLVFFSLCLYHCLFTHL